MEHTKLVKLCEDFLEKYICSGNYIYVFDDHDKFLNKVIKTITEDSYSQFVTLGVSFEHIDIEGLPSFHVRATFSESLFGYPACVSLIFVFEHEGVACNCKPVKFTYDVL